jgi:hypothetical protein
MSALDEACATIVARVEDAFAAAVVLLDTGMVVGAHASPPDVEPMVLAAIARDMVPPARRAMRIEGAAGGAFEEIYVATPRYSHFAKIVRGGRALLVVVMRRTSNVGMGWIQVRGCAPIVEPLIPAT